jgi:hypothetical protein
MVKKASKRGSTLTFMIYRDPHYSGPSASVVETEENTENTGPLMALNQQLKMISKWNTPLISFAAQVLSSNKNQK